MSKPPLRLRAHPEMTQELMGTFFGVGVDDFKAIFLNGLEEGFGVDNHRDVFYS